MLPDYLSHSVRINSVSDFLAAAVQLTSTSSPEANFSAIAREVLGKDESLGRINDVLM